DGRRDFHRAYDATCGTFKGLMAEIYDEVQTGNEIRSVVMAAGRFRDYPMTNVEGSPMWTTGAGVRKQRGRAKAEIDGFTAGTFCGAVVAQGDFLVEHGHPDSESADQAAIEARGALRR